MGEELLGFVSWKITIAIEKYGKTAVVCCTKNISVTSHEMH